MTNNLQDGLCATITVEGGVILLVKPHQNLRTKAP
jgi:hypothetical protein